MFKVDSWKFQGPGLAEDSDALAQAKSIKLERPENLPDTCELLVALDIDGTVTRSDGKISPRTIQQVNRLVSAGAKVTIATGRSAESTAPILQQLQLKEAYLACANGAVIMHAYQDEQAVAKSREIMSQRSRIAAEQARRNGHPSATWRTTEGLNGSYSPLNGQTRIDENGRELVHVQNSPLCFEVIRRHVFNPTRALEKISENIPGVLIGSETVDAGFLVSGEFPHGELLEASAIVDLEELKLHESTRVVVRAPNMDVAEFSELVAGAGLDDFETAVGWTAWMDLAAKGVSKALGLEELRQTLGVARPACVAAGDGLNDIAMIEWAAAKPSANWSQPGGWAIAMGNAHEEIKKRADTVTTHTDLDGLALALEQL